MASSPRRPWQYGIRHRVGQRGRLAPSNKRLELTAPLGGRSGNVVVEAAASRSPFGERRRRSSSAVLCRRGLVRHE